jgi:predicted amidophosphoribosyltransferase
MPIIKCKECGKEISFLAETCPHCGAPNANPITIFQGLLSLAGLLFLIWWLVKYWDTIKTWF